MKIYSKNINEKERKRSHLLEVAETLIKSRGLDRLNMDEVAENASVSKGTLYLYFKNKNDLILGICSKATEILTNRIAAILTKDLTGLEMVREMGSEFLSYVTEHPEYFSTMRFFHNLQDTEELNENKYVTRCQQNKDASFTSMVRAIQIGMQDGSINPDFDPKELAILLWGTSLGIMSVAYFHQNKPHFELIEKHRIEVSNLFDSYMKLIGCGIAVKPLTDSKS